MVFNSKDSKRLTSLVIVAGHSIYIGKTFENILDDSNWILFSFQKGEPKLYIEHIIKGCEIAKADKNALLIFTGGQSRKEANAKSESQSYFELADHLGLINEDLRERSTTEEFSRDSFENLLFPICRFREFLGYYPNYITFVSFAFKERRFHLIRKVLRLTEDKVKFLGFNNPENLELALEGEEKAIKLMEEYPYYNGGELLQKKEQRNPWKRQNGYLISCPELKDLFLHIESGKRELFRGNLPWD